MKYKIIDPTYEELNLVKPILLALVFAIACLFISDRYTSNKCACWPIHECYCKTDNSSSCECNLIECEDSTGE